MTISKPREDATTWMSGEYSNANLRLRQAVVKEQMSTLTEITIEFLARKTDVDLEDFLGKLMSVHVELMTVDDQPPPGYPEGRVFTGTCISVEAMGMRGGDDHFVAQVRPWFWMLTQSRNTRVFQEKTVPQIIEEVLGDHGFSEYEIKSSETYEVREYCVQYRETDFDFLSRLMEEEGLYYFFDHTDALRKQEKLIICDGLTAHKVIKGVPPPQPPARAKPAGTLTFKPRDGADSKTGQTIGEWAAARSVTRGKVSLADYDFEKPSVRQLEISAIESGRHNHRKYENYDHPGHYRGEKELGGKRARVRMEADAIRFFMHRGAGDVRHFGTGFLFTLSDHPEETNNAEYLITEAMHYIRDSEEMSDNENWFALKPKGDEIPEEVKSDYSFTFGVVPKNKPFRAPLTTPWPEIPGIQIGEVVGPAGKEIHTDEYGRVKVRFRWDRVSPDDDTASCWIRVATQWSGNNWGLLSIPRIGQEVVVQFEDGDPDRPIVTGMMYNKDKMPPYVDPQQPTRTGIMTRSSPDGKETDYNALVMEDEAGSEYVHMQAQKDYQLVVKDSAHITIGHDEVNVDEARQEVDSGSMKQTVKQNLTELVEEGDKSETIDQGKLDLTVEGNMTELVRTGNMTLDVERGHIAMTAAQKITLTVGGSSIEITQSGVTVKGTGTAKMEAPLVTAQASGLLTLKGSMTKIN